MEPLTNDTDWAKSLQALHDGEKRYSRSGLRQLVKRAAEHLEASGPTPEVLELLDVLARDTKWEVRKEVADCLWLLPDEDFVRQAAMLSDDENQFVRRSAESAMARRQRGEASLRQKQQRLANVGQQYAAIEKAHGTMAADKAMRMAERLYDVLVGATVHDMRNLITPIKSGILSMQAQLDGSPPDPRLLVQSLQKMRRQTAMLERMMDDMRAYSQVTPEARSRVQVSALVREAHQFVLDAFAANERDVSPVKCEADIPESLTVDVARDHIVRAVANVIKNAYEAFATDPYTFGAGRVILQARQVEDQIEITVSDNGMGLPVEELEEVRQFIPGGTSKKTHGTGFGLPFAKRKVNDHGGSLSINSVEDEGTIVTIALPMESME